MNVQTALPLVFMGLLGVAMLLYVISDGYDLGVGMLTALANDDEKDVLVSSIGPYWDANETWLVLGIGILLIAFPKADTIVSRELYLPITAMLIGLIVRGVAFDFRVKARAVRKRAWNRAFLVGSAVPAVAQGWMLGRFVSGFGDGWNYPLFAAAIAVALPMTYVMMGAAWLILKTEGAIQAKAVHWARVAWWPMVIGLLLVSMATPWISQTVRDRWFTMPALIALSSIPATTAGLLLAVRLLLGGTFVRGAGAWLPFVLLIAVFVLGFLGLAYSIYPWIVIDRMTVWQAASSTDALELILIGVCISLPAIAGYTIFSYRLFRGKVKELAYA